MKIRMFSAAALLLACAWCAAGGRAADRLTVPEEHRVPLGARDLPIADTPIVPEGLGVNIHFTDPRPGEMTMLAAGGFRWIRMDLAWGGTERQKGVYDFSAYDRLMAALEPQGIRALFILDYSNRHYDDGLSPHSDAGRQAFARWAAAAVQHFRGRGILWEMYNEPNIHFWRPEPNPKHYVLLALEVGRAIREVAPEEVYIGPATSGVDLEFLETCFQAGLLEYWSAVSVHPYRQQPPETAAADYARLRRLIARYAPGKRIPILSGEWGYSSVWQGMDREQQGKLLPRQWLTNLAQHIPLSIWYDWHDDGRDPKEPEHHFGTVRHEYQADADPVYEAKPAFHAARTLTNQLAGLRFDKRLDVGDPDAHVLLFSGSAGQRLVAWTTAAQTRAIRVPASAGRFTITDHLGRRMKDAVAGHEGLPLTLSDAPQYLAPQEPNPLLQIAAAWQPVPLDWHVPAQRKHAFALKISNPLDRAIGVGTGSSPPVELGPGEETRLEYSFDVLRRAEVQMVRLECIVDGLGTIAQQLPVTAQDPLEVTPYPATDRCLEIAVENPSGRPFRGCLRVTDASGLQLSKPGLPLHFQPDQRHQVVRSELDQPPAAAYRLGLLIDGGGPPLELPATTYRRVDEFSGYSPDELPGVYRIVPDGDRQVGSEQSLALAVPPEGPPLPGAGVLKITYRFDAGWKFARLVPLRDPLRKIDGRPRAVGMWIYGDGSGNHPRLRISDSTGQTFQPDGPRLNWTGWRYVEFALKDRQMGHWGGAGDGVIHFPIRWDTLLLIDSAGRKQTAGEVYLACPTLIE